MSDKKLEKLIQLDLSGKHPKWCKHMNFWSMPSKEIDGIMFPPSGGWSYQYSGINANNWKYCPVCGKPKPK